MARQFIELARREISTKQVGPDGVHRDESDTLQLDGIATKPTG